MSFLVCLAALAFLIFVAYRGFSVILFAPIAALGAVLLTDPAAVPAAFDPVLVNFFRAHIARRLEQLPDFFLERHLPEQILHALFHRLRRVLVNVLRPVLVKIDPIGMIHIRDRCSQGIHDKKCPREKKRSFHFVTVPLDLEELKWFCGGVNPILVAADVRRL